MGSRVTIKTIIRILREDLRKRKICPKFPYEFMD
jgi:hypothetical protein